MVEACLARIEETEPTLNSFITLAPEQARDAARRAEAEIGRGNYRGPLHGIPVGLKDLFNTAGVKTTSGTRIYDNFIPDEDCTVATRFGQAGAILLGKLNMHPLAFGPTGENGDYGHMHNPWNPERITGGSSGGSGSAAAAGQCTITMGSDTGGSVRIPAALCGIVGLKPTYGRVSRAGLTPLSWCLDHPGPMVRTVEDAALAMNVIAGHDPRDHATTDVPVPDYTSALTGDIRGLRIGVVREYFETEIDPAVATLTQQAITVLGELGAEIVEVSLPSLRVRPAHQQCHPQRRGDGRPPGYPAERRGQAVPSGPGAAGRGTVHLRDGVPAGATSKTGLLPAGGGSVGERRPPGRSRGTGNRPEDPGAQDRNRRGSVAGGAHADQVHKGVQHHRVAGDFGALRIWARRVAGGPAPGGPQFRRVHGASGRVRIPAGDGLAHAAAAAVDRLLEPRTKPTPREEPQKKWLL